MAPLNHHNVFPQLIDQGQPVTCTINLRCIRVRVRLMFASYKLTVSSSRIFSRLCHVMLCAASCDRRAFFLMYFNQQVSAKMVFVLAACALLSLSPLLVLGVPPTRTQPEQVHLSYPGKCFTSFVFIINLAYKAFTFIGHRIVLKSGFRTMRCKHST